MQRSLVANALYAPLPDAALFTIQETSVILKASERHIATLVQTGKISSIKIGRCRRISRAEILRLLTSGT